MRSNSIRLMILGALIVLCVWQTGVLWLGDMSGHIFFTDSMTSYVSSYVHPKQVWCNIQGNIKSGINNSSNAGIYKLESEKEDLVNELIKELRKSKLIIEQSPKETYRSLLNGSQGIIYEFATELTIDEIIGQDLDTRINKYKPVKIKEIFVDLSLVDAYKTYVYLIDKEAKVRQKITLNYQLNSAIEMVNLYADKENVSDHLVYQASINSISDSNFMVGNAFYPRMGSDMVIEGKNIQLRPIIEDLESKELENYVNYLFKTPSNKTQHLTETGIAFSDNLNISVKYNNIGTLEFQKTLLNDEGKLSDVERMNQINTFIEQNGAIPEFLKKGLYLEGISENAKTGETIYQFGYRYEDGHIVVLGAKAKAQLGMNAFLELGIKNSEVTSGKWVMLQPYEVGIPKRITMSSSEAINAIYENSGLMTLDEFKDKKSNHCSCIVCMLQCK